MSSLPYFQPRREPGLLRSVILAFAVHLVLLIVMVLGVRWQNHPSEAVTVELWESAPPPPPPAVEPPKPTPVAEPPKPPPPPKAEPKPEPKVEKPDIAEKAPPPKPKAEPKPEPKPQPKPQPKVVAKAPPPKPKPAPPKDDAFQKKMMQEQLALEQTRLDEARKKAEAERLARELASTARAHALNEYISRIQRKVRSNWILPLDLKGNPEAVFKVVQLPTGEILNATLSKSSGIPAYDDAVLRAIKKSSPLPLPASRDDFSRELELTFRPKD